MKHMGEDAEGSHMIMNGVFECASIPIICHVIELVKKGVIKNKSYEQFSYDLLEANYR
jgi:hypothetical protein